MNTVFEINMANARADVNTGRVKPTSPVVEVFSALVAGKKPNVDAKTKDKAVKTLAELSSKAIEGDFTAQSEINAIIRFSIEPKLLEMVRLYDFMGTYHRIGYHEAPFMKTYKYEWIPASRHPAPTCRLLLTHGVSTPSARRPFLLVSPWITARFRAATLTALSLRA